MSKLLNDVKKYVMTPKIRLDVNIMTLRQRFCHHVNKYIITSESTSCASRLRHDIKNMSRRQKVQNVKVAL